MTHLLTLDNVSLSFDMGANSRYDALSGICLQIAAGDRVGLLVPMAQENPRSSK